MSSDSDSAKTVLTPQSAGDTFKLPLGPSKPGSKPDVIMTDATPEAQTTPGTTVLSNSTIDNEVPPTQLESNLD